ncbi:hypothetical protein VPH35_132966 [Triticum aestivum]|uniref:GDSL esterase/lipase n=1 Tax=Triticum aestivum TaxID=4565 RepID=A0A077S3B7_WHEAT|nr:unnamed protein product [Triticum aestivum]
MDVYCMAGSYGKSTSTPSGALTPSCILKHPQVDLPYENWSLLMRWSGREFRLHRLMAGLVFAGLEEVTTACCGSGKFDGKSGCTPNATLCDSRHKYLFWDLLHATSKLAAAAIYNGSPHLAAPINFRQLAEDQC